MTITVKKLKEFLNKFPEELEIIETRCSDYEYMDLDSWDLVKTVDQEGHWLMRSHPTMSESNKEKEKEYLHFKGN